MGGGEEAGSDLDSTAAPGINRTAKVKRGGCGDGHRNRRAAGDRKEQIPPSSFFLSPSIALICKALQGVSRRSLSVVCRVLPQHHKAEHRRVGLKLRDNSLIAGTSTKH